MSKKSKEEILAEAHGVKQEYLVYQIGRESANRSLEAMEAYVDQERTIQANENAKQVEDLASRVTSLQSTNEKLLAENDRLREAIKSALDRKDKYVLSNLFGIRKILESALNP